jgi:hypothetical protein
MHAVHKDYETEHALHGGLQGIDEVMLLDYLMQGIQFGQLVLFIQLI